MDYINVDYIGYAAGLLITISLLPQFIKSWKTKSTKDLSFLRYVIYVLGISLWLIYGILLENWPIIVVNIITLLMAISILFLKLKYG